MRTAPIVRRSAIAGVSPQVAGILASLETRATRIGSATLAQDIQTSFTGVVPLLPDPHRSANFAVLRDPSTPSTLLEMGCLTNPLDEALLTSPPHRRADGRAADHAPSTAISPITPARSPGDATSHVRNISLGARQWMGRDPAISDVQ